VYQYSSIISQRSESIFLSLGPEWLSNNLPAKLSILGGLILEDIHVLEEDGFHLLYNTVLDFSAQIIENNIVLNWLEIRMKKITSNSKVRIP